MTTAVGNLAQTALPAASAIAAADDFFTQNPPLRVNGTPATATSLVAGTPANTVFWYTGESSATPARQTALAQVGPTTTVAYGMRDVLFGMAAVMVIAFLAGVIGLSAVLVVQTRANAAMVAANEELTRSKAAVQVRYDLALEAIKTFHAGVAEDVLLTNDNLKPVRDRLLKDAAKFYQRLGEKLTGRAERQARRALNRQVREALSSCHSQTTSGSGSCSSAVRCVPVSAPNSGTVVEAATGLAGSIDTKCTATVSPASAPSM